MKNNWTLKEEKVLIKNIQKYPHNLSKAFYETSTKISRTPKACSQKWYGNYCINKQGEMSKGLKTSSPVFMTVSNKVSSINTKTIFSHSLGRTKKSTKSIWTTIVSFFKL